MPRTLLDAQNRKDDRISALIWGELMARGITVDELALRTKIGRGVLYRRLKSPGDFTVKELCRICRNLSIPIETLRDTIKY